MFPLDGGGSCSPKLYGQMDQRSKRCSKSTVCSELSRHPEQEPLCQGRRVYPVRPVSEAGLHLPPPGSGGLAGKQSASWPVYDTVSTVNFVFIFCERGLYALNLMEVLKKKKAHFRWNFSGLDSAQVGLKKNWQVKVKHSRRLLEMQSVNQKIIKTSECLVCKFQWEWWLYLHTCLIVVHVHTSWNTVIILQAYTGL